MSEEVLHDYIEEISDALHSVKLSLRKARNENNAEQKASHGKAAQKAMSKIDTKFNMYREELEMMRSGETKQIFLAAYEKLQRKAQELNHEMEGGPHIVTLPSKSSPVLTSSEIELTYVSPEVRTQHYTMGQVPMLDDAVEIASSSTAILQDISKRNEETIDIGAEAAKRLQTQTQKMKDIQHRLNELGTGAKRARRELGAFMRMVFCDKVILLVILFVILAVAVFVVLRIVFPQYFTVSNLARLTNPSSSNTVK